MFWAIKNIVLNDKNIKILIKEKKKKMKNLKK